MVTLLYHWNFTGANNLSLEEAIYDTESSLVAKVKRRGTYSSSSFSRDENGIFLNNDDSTNGGYYIDLEGLNTAEFGGNLSIEMAVQNHVRDFKAIYFVSVGEESGTNQAFINARFNGNVGKNKMFFGVRTDEKNDSSGVSYTERKIDEDNSTVIDDSDEHHYIFSFNYDGSGSSVKLYIDGDKKGENTADLEKTLTTTARNSNLMGTIKAADGATYLKGVIKYLKIYQNSVSDDNATTLYNNYNSSNYSWEDYSSETNSNKYTRRHNNVNTHFTNNSSLTSFTILGNQLGLNNQTQSYKIHKFTSGSTYTIGSSDNYNYIPLEGQNQFIILNYDSNYFKVTQTSSASNENSLYKCEVSVGSDNNYSLVCQDKGFGETYTYDNVTIIFGGVEFNFSSNAVCFHEDTLIKTDQGKFKIKDLSPFNTIENCRILSIVKSDVNPENLVLIKKNAFCDKKPENDIKITLTHTIFINNKHVPIYTLINNDTIQLVRNDSENVYNIVVHNKDFINVDNLLLGVICLTDEIVDQIRSFLKTNYHDNTNINFSIESFKNTIIKKKKNFIKINTNDLKIFYEQINSLK